MLTSVIRRLEKYSGPDRTSGGLVFAKRDNLRGDVQFPERVTHGFPQHGFRPRPPRVRARIRTRREVYLDSLMLKQFADAEDVIGIADRDTTVHVVGAHDDSDQLRGLRRIRGMSLG